MPDDTETVIEKKWSLGASEIAAAAGLSPYESPLQLWLRHTGRAPQLEQNPEMSWGLDVEPAILRAYERGLDPGFYCKVPPPDPGWPKQHARYHADHPWLRATPDAYVVTMLKGGADEPRWLAQAKNVGWRLAHLWDAGPPLYVVCQVQVEMLVTGLERDDVVASIGGQAPRTFTVYRDERMQADLLEIAAGFKARVERDQEPPVTHHDDHAEWLAKRAGAAVVVASEVPYGPEVEVAMDSWRQAVRDAAAAKRYLELAKNRIRKILADAGAERIESQLGVATWRAHDRRTVDWDAAYGELVDAVCTSVGGDAPYSEEAEAIFRAFADDIRARHTTTTEVRQLRGPRNWTTDTDDNKEG